MGRIFTVLGLRVDSPSKVSNVALRDAQCMKNEARSCSVNFGCNTIIRSNVEISSGGRVPCECEKFSLRFTVYCLRNYQRGIVEDVRSGGGGMV